MAILYLQEIFAEHLRSGQTPGNGQGRDKIVPMVPRSKSAGRSRTNGRGWKGVFDLNHLDRDDWECLDR